MIHKKYCWLVLSLICISSFAQNGSLTVIDVLKKASEKFKTEKNLSYNLKYNLYNDEKSSKIDESYSGFLVKRGNSMYYKIKDTEFVGFNDYSVKVSNEEKAIIIAKGESKESPLDIDKFLKGFNYKFLGNDSTHWVCELTPSKVSQIMYRKIIIHINKKDYSIYKQILYFLNPVEENNKITRPRLEMVYTSRTTNEEKDNSLVDEKKYFTRVGKEIKVANRYKEYTLYKI